MNFDLQTYLSEMRQEQKEDHAALLGRVDAIVDKLSDHETRIVVIESGQRAALWLGGAVVVGFITFCFDILVNHAPRLLAHLASSK